MGEDSPRSDKARQAYNRAIDLYRGGDRAGAAKALGSALDVDLTLAQREPVAKLAAAITDLELTLAADRKRLSVSSGKIRYFVLGSCRRKAAIYLLPRARFNI